jgi:hypothetical protein
MALRTISLASAICSGVKLAGLVALHFAQGGVVADERGDVERRAMVEPRQVRADVEHAAAAVAGDDRGDAVADEIFR